MKKNTKKEKLLIAGFILIEITLLSLIFFPSILTSVLGEVSGNATAISQLTIGSSPPEIVSIEINDSGAGLNLVANSTTTVFVNIIALDHNGETDIVNISAEFFDNDASALGNADDNNDHYTNSSCTINTAYGDSTEVNATCIFELEYYANNQTWNLTALISDAESFQDVKSNTSTVNALLAIGLPDTIDYGLVNTTGVSDENVTNVTNFGNVQINLTLEGYAHFQDDNNSMNCTLGAIQNISVEHTKFNLTANNSDLMNLTTFDVFFANLSGQSETKTFDLAHRQNDGSNEATRETYWRIYVPVGVAGSCTGNIIFGALQAPES